MPTVMENVKRSLWNYPSLYGNDQYSLYRVLCHLYFKNGNGYEWENGEIFPIFADEELKISTAEHREKLTSFFRHIDIRRWFTDFQNAKMKPMGFYSLCEYALISTMPDNVTDDYLLWALRFLEFAVHAPSWWYDYIGHDGIEEKAYATEFREYFLYKWRDRIANLQEPWRLPYSATV